MVKVTVTTVDDRQVVMAPESSTVREVLDNNGINYSHATLMIDGIILNAQTVNCTLDELKAGEECIIAVTVKMDNA